MKRVLFAAAAFGLATSAHAASARVSGTTPSSFQMVTTSGGNGGNGLNTSGQITVPEPMTLTLVGAGLLGLGLLRRRFKR
jgi:hypothetical protein